MCAETAEYKAVKAAEMRSGEGTQHALLQSIKDAYWICRDNMKLC